MSLKILGTDQKIFVAGHRGLVGSAIVRALGRFGHKAVITRSRSELDLRDSAAVRSFFKYERPDHVILAAAKVGGIGANSAYPVEFLLENLQIQNAVISAAGESDVRKFVFLGSSCIYPRNARYPLTEDQLLTSSFEPTNEAYALAKVAGIKLCEYYSREYKRDFISVMPTNLYGPNDYYHFENSHVIPAMLLKVLKAKKEDLKSVTLWGTGSPKREFLHSDDLAEAILLCLERYSSPDPINIGSQEEIAIGDLAQRVCDACDFTGAIRWDHSRPDGVMRKVMDSSKIRALGWKPTRRLDVELRKIVGEAQQKLS